MSNNPSGRDLSGRDLSGRNFLKELDFGPNEWRELLTLSASLKAAKAAGTEQQHLSGKNIALIFEKTSTRTRCAFEVAAFDQGAHVTYLDPSGSQIGHKESMKDTARVLGRMYDGIEYRGSRHELVETLGKFAGVPVWNGLTDEWHPTHRCATCSPCANGVPSRMPRSPSRTAVTPAATWATRCSSPAP